MKKYRCPKCGETFRGELEECPRCQTKLHYKRKEKVKEETEAKIVQKFNFDDPDLIKHEDKIPETQLIEDDDKEERKEQQVRTVQNPQANKIEVTGDSFFDGKLHQKIGKILLGFLLMVITVGFAFPWVVCMFYRWKTKHTVIQGHRLVFTGKGSQLFGRYLLWFFLCILTAFIFSLWVSIYLERWKTKHTEFAD